ncbi:uncharacterized protein MONBRDRAFT_36548 [Monosiga brevicollis MX1]|uniref:Copper transport protein n=1 Tax=Monosiga brevicollis TaxID=81824 RepID=A9UVZ5_MONBE|nr:uncharacterized protein MONBRDRAFT_36548 [Monosiga brevicollis MX1]EDQ90677.1 predicted protein [Monosiga brevicollis MX1]|eukprot:XP_001744728.1 hypothetical protein [Monosiga brevicollis MX1]
MDMDDDMGMPSNGFCSGSGMVMNDGFGRAPSFCPIFLFHNVVIDTAGKYAIALIGTFCMGLFNELFRWYRNRLEAQESTRPILQDLCVALSYGIHMLNAYFLMLLVMLYESLFFVMIILGLATGSFVVRQLQRHVRKVGAYQDLDGRKPSALTPIVQTPSGTSPCCGGN